MRRDNGSVYFVLQDFEKERLGLVKVGYAQNPETRVRELQTGSPHELRLLAHWPAPRALEGWVHSELSRFHIRGEWFAIGAAWQEVAFWGMLEGITLGDICAFIGDHWDALEAKHAGVERVG